MSDGCGNCHEKVTASFKDSFHGKATSLENKKAAACADCHTPHANLPASDKRSSIHPDNLAKTCGACHANVNASFLSFDPHANPSDPTRNPYVYWIWLGMTSLLIGVFGFFGLHGLLWMQRALVGKMRGEFNVQPRRRRAPCAPLQQHADGRPPRHRHQLPAAGGHRPAAEVRPCDLGAKRHVAAGRRRDGRLAAPPRRGRDLRLLHLAPRHAGAWPVLQEANAATSGARVRWCRSRATSSTSSA